MARWSWTLVADAGTAGAIMIAAGLGGAALAVGACRPAEPDARAAFHAVDDAGDSVAFARPVRRIVSLIPATTELFFAFGAGPMLVGRTDWCDYPPAAARVPSVGAGIGPNLEAVIATRPDLVVSYLSARNAESARRLRALGIPTLQLRTDRLSDVPRLARLLGGLTGRWLAADSLATAFTRELAASSVPEPADRQTVFLLAWERPPMTVGRGSFLTEVIERAGGRNLFDDIAASSAPVSIEAVAARDPDVILALGDEPLPFIGQPEWRGIGAVRDRRFLRGSGTEFSYPSPRAPAAVRALASQLARIPPRWAAR